MEKQKTTVRVAGKDYALVSTDSPEHLNRVAAYVDRQMTETMRSGRIPANTAAVLTALNLADDLMLGIYCSFYDGAGVSRLRARPKGNGNGRSPRSPFGNLRLHSHVSGLYRCLWIWGTVWVSCG